MGERLGFYDDFMGDVYLYLANSGWALEYTHRVVTPASQWRDATGDTTHTTRNALMIQMNRDWNRELEQGGKK